MGGPYGGPSGWVFSCERGTPVAATAILFARISGRDLLTVGVFLLVYVVYLVIYDSGWVSFEHLLLSWYPSITGSESTLD